jgi:hypothetical protein
VGDAIRINLRRRRIPLWARAVKPATSAAFSNIPHAMHFHTGSYDYLLSQTATGAEYSTTNGQQSASAAVSWAFGDRQFGDTFLYQQNGIYFESRLSNHRALNGPCASAPSHPLHAIPLGQPEIAIGYEPRIEPWLLQKRQLACCLSNSMACSPSAEKPRE